MTSGNMKDKIHKQYQETVGKVLSGELPYKAATKSPLSRTYNGRFKDLPIPEFGYMCSTCNDTKEVENPLTGEMHFCPFCGDN